MRAALWVDDNAAAGRYFLAMQWRRVLDAGLVIWLAATALYLAASDPAALAAISLLVFAYFAAAVLVAARGRRRAELSLRRMHEQDERAGGAVAREQQRIAQELHDVVAHHMSVISVQASLGGYVIRSDPDTARTALEVIGKTARESLSEMRRLIALLRMSTTAPYTAAPSLGELADLIERVRSAGATIQLTSAGQARPLPPGLGLCAYRVIQESLTNVLKHADPPIATVALDWHPQKLIVTITDQGQNQAGPSGGTGYGLIGMRERARIYGGALTAGPGPEGGFEVSLTLPTEEPAA
jgi:signal transduction histidine kinase